MLYKLYLWKNKLEYLYIQRLLKDIRKHKIFKDKIQWSELGNCAEAPCGVWYDTLCCNGIKDRGQSAPGYCSPFEAYTRFLGVLANYVDCFDRDIHEQAIFFWRRLPELRKDSLNNLYYITCRLCNETRELTEDRLDGRSWIDDKTKEA